MWYFLKIDRVQLLERTKQEAIVLAPMASLIVSSIATGDIR